MILLNYLYFLIITGYGIKLLFQHSGVVVHPLNKNQLLRFDGPEMFWVLTFATGLLALSAPGALDLMAIRLLVLEVFCFIGLFLAKQSPVWSPASWLYLLYIIWLVIGLLYTPAPDYGIRVIMKYMYPLLIMLFASATVRNGEVFLKAALLARWVALVCLVTSFIPGISMLIPGVFWYGTARSIHFITICVFSLALYYYGGKKKSDLYWAILFALPCFVWMFRTSIMGTLLALMTFFFFRYRLKSLPIIVSIILLSVIAIFTIPSIRQKMFFDENVTIAQLQEGEITKESINSNARFAMWEHLTKRLYDNKEAFGSGTGSTQQYMYTNNPFRRLKVPHNDYVQMACDNGYIGVVLYLLIGISIIVHCFTIYTRNHSTIIKICAITAGSATAGVLLTLYSDNVVNYSMATLSMPFGFYGMALGLQSNQQKI